MKSFSAVKAGGIVLVAAMSMQVSAQGEGAAASASANVEAKTETKAQHRADRALQKKVRNTLAKTKGLDVSNIVVRARDGAVTLEGTVPERAQIDLAGNAAKAVPGVISLKNALAIRPKGA